MVSFPENKKFFLDVMPLECIIWKMHINSRQINASFINTIFFLLWSIPFLFAQEANLSSTGNRGYAEGRLSSREDNSLSELQKQAREYRAQGLELQRLGNLDTAASFYQKAIELDPAYAITYNDLGILYEAKGFIDRAQDAYLQAIKIDPDYLSAYTNLALIYENKRDLKNAYLYWKKRAESGSADDPWTQKARQRLEDIRLVLSDRLFENNREEEVIEFLKDMQTQKAAYKKDNSALAKDYFQKAKIKFKDGDGVTALKIAIDAQQLDPANTQIQEFIEKIQARLLSR